MASDVVDSIDAEETIGLLQDLVRNRSPYFEETGTGAFVHDWLGERDLSPKYHPVTEPGITQFEGDNVIPAFASTRVLPNAGYYDPLIQRKGNACPSK